MKLQAQNPIYPYFAHLLPPSERYPAEHVDIFWNRNADDKVVDVEVVFVPRTALKEEPLKNRYDRFNQSWACDLGNSSSDWLQEDGLTPAMVFGRLLRAGFASDTELIQALQEFAHIEECAWAREMLRSFTFQ